jgi:hypothetical protein
MDDVNVALRREVAPPVAVAATLALAAACWAVAAWLMNGMDMGVATRPGAFGFFAAAWVTMMAAMMLPGAAPAVWMAVVTVLASAQKLLPAKAAIDVPVALAIIGFGLVLVT